MTQVRTPAQSRQPLRQSYSPTVSRTASGSEGRSQFGRREDAFRATLTFRCWQQGTKGLRVLFRTRLSYILCSETTTDVMVILNIQSTWIHCGLQVQNHDDLKIANQWVNVNFQHLIPTRRNVHQSLMHLYSMWGMAEASTLHWYCSKKLLEAGIFVKQENCMCLMRALVYVVFPQPVAGKYLSDKTPWI